MLQFRNPDSKLTGNDSFSFSVENSHSLLVDNEWSLIRSPMMKYRLTGSFLLPRTTAVLKSPTVSNMLVVADQGRIYNGNLHFLIPADDSHYQIFGIRDRALTILSKPFVLKGFNMNPVTFDNALDDSGTLSVLDDQISYFDFRIGKRNNGVAHFCLNPDGMIASRKMDVDELEIRFCVPKGTTTVSKGYEEITAYVKEKLSVNSVLMK